MTAVLDSSATLISTLVEAMPEPVLVISDSVRLFAANAPAQALFPHLRLDAPLSSSIRTVDLHDAIVRVLAGTGAEDISWLARAPMERLYQAHIAPFEAGKAIFVAVTLHDATESRRLEQARVDFVANASHELRTPLSSILGFVETLLGPARDDAAARHKFLEIMLQQGRRMKRLIDDLLSLSRIEQTLHVQPRDAVDLANIVEQVCDALTPVAIDSRVGLDIEAQKTIVRGDRDELLRVAENLIENAIKYSAPDEGQPDRKVWITIESRDGVGVMSVRDEGPGIAPENIPRLTERFFRVDVGQSRAKGGTGLGLALVKHILARHRGRLTVRSTLGSGATFTASAPLF